MTPTHILNQALIFVFLFDVFLLTHLYRLFVLTL